MASRIEQIIDEMEEYIANCKPAPFSPSKIIVNREEIEELISELRSKTPKEIERYQKIISNKEAILADAQTKADTIIAKAQVKTDELVSEHQIMQQAYTQADEVVRAATAQAEETIQAATAQAEGIVNNAMADANNIRLGAMQYTDDILKNLEAALSREIQTAQKNSGTYIGALQNFLNTVASNRAELHPAANPPAPAENEPTDGELPNVEITAENKIQ